MSEFAGGMAGADDEPTHTFAELHDEQRSLDAADPEGRVLEASVAAMGGLSDAVQRRLVEDYERFAAHMKSAMSVWGAEKGPGGVVTGGEMRAILAAFK